MNDGDSESKIIFKKKTNRSTRKRVSSSSDEDEEKMINTLVDLKELQKMRNRQHGIDVDSLNQGFKNENENKTKEKSDNQVTGGMIDLATIKKTVSNMDDAYETGIGKSFSSETNAREEDEEMVKYIESEIKKHKGVEETKEMEDKHLTPEDAALLAVPEYLVKSVAKKSEDMLSNQMLSGIPEVDLGIDVRIKNIEETEAAKVQLLKDNMKKKDGPSVFVPANMAVNFMQHNRYKIDDRLSTNKQPTTNTLQPAPVKSVPQVDGKRKIETKPSDNFAYEKFKKQFRR